MAQLKDYLPKGDKKFDLWQENFMNKAGANLLLWLILALDYTNLQALQATWETNWGIAKTFSTRSPKDVKKKTVARRAYVKGLRAFVKKWIAGNNLITDGDRVALGTTVFKTTRTKSPVTKDAPVINAATAGHLLTRIDYQNPLTPDSKAKPEGVKELIVKYMIGGLATDPSQCTEEITFTKTPSMITHEVGDVGKTLSGFACWKNNDNSISGWSLIFSVIIN
jgi:hypothetical protein